MSGVHGPNRPSRAVVAVRAKAEAEAKAAAAAKVAKAKAKAQAKAEGTAKAKAKAKGSQQVAVAEVAPAVNAGLHGCHCKKRTADNNARQTPLQYKNR